MVKSNLPCVSDIIVISNVPFVFDITVKSNLPCVSDIMVISTYLSFPTTARIYAEKYQSFQQFSIYCSDGTIIVQLCVCVCVCVSVVFPWNVRPSVCRAVYCLEGLSVT